MEGMEHGNDGTYGVGRVGNKKFGADGKGAAGEAAFDAYAEHSDGGPPRHAAVNIEQAAGI